ncbi:AI-2E family transporter [Candidatus Legionella polyplacis]|uniref:AI-2E family transporter n=1 Tax=Candidatus Legionella polyplacis TaxID=2005262 RepID=UPI001F45318F|nr:AI-2E family transporter [Candidatus Legionella polyplacis]
MGICYFLVGFPTPVLTGFITAFASIIPFIVPIIFIIVSLILLIKGSFIFSIIVIVYGGLVIFIADHFIKPIFIRGSTKLPFLYIFFGILGGLRSFGLLGLFVGPIIMMLFMFLLEELKNN